MSDPKSFPQGIEADNITFTSAETVAIVTGVLTVTKSTVIVQAETGTADDVDTINGLSANEVAYFRNDTGDTITYKANTDNIRTNDNADITINDTGVLIVQSDGTNVIVAAGGGSGLVDSVFGRVGTVAALASDYDASQIDNDSGVTGVFVDDALNTLDTSKQAQGAALDDINAITFAQGDIIYHDGTNVVKLGAGTSGQFLKTQGAAMDPVWDNPSGSGDVTGPGSSTANAIVVFLDGTGKAIAMPSTSLDANTQKIINVTDPTLAQDAATKNWTDTNFQPLNASLTDIAAITFAQGDIIYYNGTDVVKLSPGTSGQFLKTLGAGANPLWDTPAGGGDVTGPAGATDNAITRYDSTTGLIIQNSGVLLGDDNAFEMPEITTPANPASNNWKLYPKTDGLYYLDDAGAETGPLGTGGGSGGSGWSNVGSEVVASTDALLEFDCSDTSKTMYRVLCIDVVGDTDNTSAVCRVFAGGAYLNTNEYQWHASIPVSSNGSYSGDNSNASSLFEICALSGFDTNESTTFEMTISNPANTSLHKAMTACGVNKTTGNVARHVDIKGFVETALAITKFKIFMSSGNILSGRFQLQGFTPTT